MDGFEVPVRAVRSVGPDTVALDVETPAGFDALPGQFVLVRADVGTEEQGSAGNGNAERSGENGECARHYTISSPEVGETFELTVGVDPEGTLSAWLAERDPGDVVRIEGPFGTVAYDADEGESVVVLAGGPGVGAAVGVAEAAVDAGHDAAVVYVDERPAHRDRLDALSHAGADVAVVEQGGFAEAVARVADVGDPYVFGFRSFCDRALDALSAAGVARESVAVESFG